MALALPPADPPRHNVFDAQEVWQFEQVWQNGSVPELETYLPPVATAPAARRALLVELIKIDLEYRMRRTAPASPGSAATARSGGPRLETYVERFPELGSLASLPADLIGEEYRARHCWDDRPGHAEYAVRFPGRRDVYALLAQIDGELTRELAAERGSPPIPHLTSASPEIRTESSAPRPGLLSVGTFLDALRQSQLLTAVQLDELQQQTPRLDVEPRALARALIQRGWLTAYQVNQLFQGRGHELVMGPYLILERLGEGGSGKVFKARHQRMNRLVALKVFRKELLSDAEVVRRFYREIRLVSQIDHPNIVHAYDAGPIPLPGAEGSGPHETHMLAMEFIDGTDLARLVKKSGPLPLAQACAYIQQAALGLQHAHARGLVHRDIKPHNLFASSRDGRVKVLDLGLARLRETVNNEMTAVLSGMKAASSLTPVGSVMMGTADYMAPEQAINFHQADIRADIYSLGCTFYFLLTGQPPFPGGNLAEKLARHLNVEAPRVELLRPDLSADLHSLIAKMLAKRPEDRFQTPVEVAAVLASLLDAGGQRSAITPAVSARSNLATQVTAAAPPQTFPLALAPVMPAPGLPLALPMTRSIPRRRWLKITLAGGLALSGASALVAWLSRPKPLPPVVPPAETTFTLDSLSAEKIPPSEKFRWQPDGLVAVLGEHRARHWEKVNSVVFTPDGRLFSGSADGFIRQWDLETGQEKTAVKAHSAVISLAFSQAKQTLASVGYDNRKGTFEIKLWNRDRVQKMWSIPNFVTCVAFSPDGNMLAAGFEEVTTTSRKGFVMVWDMATGNPRVETLNTADPVNSVAFNPDGKLLASGGGSRMAGELIVWDVENLKKTGTNFLEPQGKIDRKAPSGAITAVEFLDDRTLAAGSNDCTVWSVDVVAKEFKPVVVNRESVNYIAISAKTKTLALASTTTISLWDLKLNRERNKLLGHTGGVGCLAFSQDGKTLVSGATPVRERFKKGAVGSEDVMVRLWDVSSLEEVRSRIGHSKGHTGSVISMAFSRNGRLLASASTDKTVRLWDMATGEQKISSPTDDYPCVCFSPDGRTVAWNDNTGNRIAILDVAEGTKKAVSYLKHKYPVHSLSYSPVGQMLATACKDGVQLWDPVHGKILDQFQHEYLTKVYPPKGILAFSHDGKILAWVSRYPYPVQPPLLWNVDTRRLRGTLGPKLARALAFCPEQSIMATGDMLGNVELWNTATNLTNSDIQGKHTEEVTTVVFDPDGKRLASAGLDGRVFLWTFGTAGGQREWQLPGPVTSLIFAPDNRHLVLGNGNGTIYILRIGLPPKS